jgi:hypothetical protein
MRSGAVIVPPFFQITPLPLMARTPVFADVTVPPVIFTLPEFVAAPDRWIPRTAALTSPPLMFTVPFSVILIAVPLTDSTVPPSTVTMLVPVIWIAVAFDLTVPPFTVTFLPPCMAVPLLVWVFDTVAVPPTVTAPVPSIVPGVPTGPPIPLVTVAFPVISMGLFVFIAGRLVELIVPPVTLKLPPSDL